MLGSDLDFAKGDSQLGCLDRKLVGDHLKKKGRKKQFSSTSILAIDNFW